MSRLAGCSFIHFGRSLERGFQDVAEFGFRHVDVGVGGAHGHFSPVEVAAEPDRFAEAVIHAADASELKLNECFTLNFGAPINYPSVAVRELTRQRFRGLARFATYAGFRSILLLPGPVHSEFGLQQSLDMAVEGFKPLRDIAENFGIALHAETDCGSCANTPALAEELCARVPGLRLTLDYSHFIVSGHEQREVERLHRYTGHVHVRQAAPGQIVASVARGFIDYERVLQKLDTANYEGLFAVEYLACPEAEDAGIDCRAETRKMASVLDEILTATIAKE